MPELSERTTLISLTFRHEAQGDWLAVAIIERDGERFEVELGSHSAEDRAIVAALLVHLERRLA